LNFEYNNASILQETKTNPYKQILRGKKIKKIAVSLEKDKEQPYEWAIIIFPSIANGQNA